ncbi:MAG: hypothetical protein Kow0069_04050 [Promethearchaeota archaeon]
MSHVAALTYELAILSISLYIGRRLLDKFAEKRTKPMLFVMVWGTMLLLSVLSSVVGRVLRVTGAWDLPSGERLEMLAFTTAFLMASSEFFLAFVLEVFHGGVAKPANKLLLGAFGGMVVASIAYSFASGVLFVEDVTVGTWVLVNLLAAGPYLLLVVDSTRLIRRLRSENDLLATRSMQAILATPLLLLVTFSFFLVDRVLGGRYSPFYFVAWAVSLVAIGTLIAGYLQPGWWKRRYVRVPPSGEVHSPRSDY